MKRWLRRSKKAITSARFKLKVYHLYFNMVFVNKHTNKYWYMGWDWNFLKLYFKEREYELNKFYGLKKQLITYDESICIHNCAICGIQNTCESSWIRDR